MNTKNVLCVGGPYDGRAVVIDSTRNFFRVAVRQPMPLFPASEPVAEISYESVIYVPCVIANVEVWTPSVMRAHDVVQLLVMRYFSGDKSEG